MAYGLSNGHVTDDVTWSQKVLSDSTVGYPSDSLASCLNNYEIVSLGSSPPTAKEALMCLKGIVPKIQAESRWGGG